MYGERHKVQIRSLEQLGVLGDLLTFLGPQYSPRQLLIQAQMWCKRVSDGDVDGDRRIVSPPRHENVCGALLSSNGNIVLHGKTSCLQKVRQLADDGLMPCCELRLVTTKNVIAKSVSTAMAEGANNRAAAVIQEVAQPPSPHDATSRRRQLQTQRLGWNRVQQRARVAIFWHCNRTMFRPTLWARRSSKALL